MHKNKAQVKKATTPIKGFSRGEEMDFSSRLLIIRFSSFGDIVQAMGVPSSFKDAHPNSSVAWLVRTDFAGLLKFHPQIDEVISFQRSQGLLGLIRLSHRLALSNYTHLYDAHNNVRSLVVRLCIFIFSLLNFRLPPKTKVRSKNRIRRWLLFKLRIHTLPRPFRGVASFQKPLASWLKQTKVKPPQFFIDPQAESRIAKEFSQSAIALVPSAAWEMKRWPIEHWKSLILAMPSENFVLLGGPEDQFCEEIRLSAPDRVLNLVGQLSLQESAAVVQKSKVVVANDTGLLHVADQLGVPTLAIIGPTAFGYPYHESSSIAETSLWCKPCSKDGRGRCINDLYKRCLIEVDPLTVAKQVQELMLRGSRG